MSSSDVSVVLVHGAWADGSSWAKVIGPLAAEGIKVVAAPLPLTSFGDDVAALDRRSSGDRAGRPRRPCLCRRRHRGDAERQGEGARLRGRARSGRGRDGRRRVLSRRAASAGAQARARRSWADLSARSGLRRRLRAECLRGRTGGAGGGPAADLAGLHHRRGRRPLWKDRPTWFLVAEQDRMIVAETQRFMATRMKARVRSHPVDHTPIVTAPGVVVDIILDADARRWSRGRRCGRAKWP